jgi:hypothetical protein
MHVKLLTNLGSQDFPGMPFLEGETHEVADTVGAALVRRKLALDVTPPPREAVAKMVSEPDKFAKVRTENKPQTSTQK